MESDREHQKDLRPADEGQSFVMAYDPATQTYHANLVVGGVALNARLCKECGCAISNGWLCKTCDELLSRIGALEVQLAEANSRLQITLLAVGEVIAAAKLINRNGGDLPTGWSAVLSTIKEASATVELLDHSSRAVEMVKKENGE